MADEWDAIDKDFRPDTYWPEGFRPVRLEKNPPPVAEMDPGGEVYWDAHDHAHYVQHPDEVEIAVVGRTGHDPGFRLCAHRDADGRIHYRFILPDPADSATPPLVVPGIISSAEPLMLGHLIEAIDMAIVSDPVDEEHAETLIEHLWQAQQHVHGSPGARTSASQGKTATSPFYPQLEAHYAMIRRRYIEDGHIRTVQFVPDETHQEDDVTRPMDDLRHEIESLTELLGLTSPESTFDLAPFDLDARPETYWPEGFTPFVAEPDAPPVGRMDPNGEVYEDAGGRWHTTTFSEEVALARMGGALPEYLCARRDGDRIRYRWVLPDYPDFQQTPAFLKPGIEESDQPLTFGELLWSLDQTGIDEGKPGATTGYLAARWRIDEEPAETRLDRMFLVNNAPAMTSTLYPELERYQRAVGAHFVQTGEFFELWDRPE